METLQVRYSSETSSSSLLKDQKKCSMKSNRFYVSVPLQGTQTISHLKIDFCNSKQLIIQFHVNSRVEQNYNKLTLQMKQPIKKLFLQNLTLNTNRFE